jgi:nicotinamidase-related amidase
MQKFRFSAFTKTPLDLLLQASDIKTVIIAGVVTQGCVEATTRDASYHDYFTVVIEDCVASTSRDLHEASLKYMASRYDILTSVELLSLWKGIICVSSRGG